MRRGGQVYKRKFEEGGKVIPNPEALENILSRMEASAYGEGGRDARTNTRFVTGRIGYRHPVGDRGEVQAGVSGQSARYGKYGKDQLSGVDVAYSDDKNRLYARYGVPMGQDKMKFAGAGYSRNLDNNRGTVGIEHRQLSQEGFPDKATQIFYRREFMRGGRVK